MPRVRSGTLHHHFAHLAMDVMKVLALNEPDDDVLEKIESNEAVLANANSTGGPLALFQRNSTKPPQDKEEEYDDEEGLWYHMWEYVLGDEVLDEPYEEDTNQRRGFRIRFWEGDDDNDDDSTSDEEDYFDEQDSQSGVGFELDNWGGRFDGNDIDTESLSSMEGTEASSISQEDMNTEEIEEIEGPTTLLKHGLLTTPKSDTRTTDHKQEDSSIDSVDHPSRERNQRKKATLRSRVLILVKPKKDIKEKKDTKQHEQEDSVEDLPSEKWANLASRLFILKKDIKENEENVSSDEERGPAKPKRASRSSQLFILAKKDTKQCEQEDSANDSEGLPSEKWANLASRFFVLKKDIKENEDNAPSDEECGSAKPKRASLSSQLFILAKPKKDTKHCGQEDSANDSEDLPSEKWANLASRLFILKKDIKDNEENAPSDEEFGSARPKRASLSSRLFLLAKPKKDTKQHSDDLPSDEEESGPAELKWERLSSRLLILAQPNKDTNVNDQEIGLIHSEDAPSDEQESEPAESTWASISSRILILKDANVHEQEVSLVVPSNEESGPAEPKWANLSSRLMSLTKTKKDAGEHEQEVSTIDSHDVPTNKESESAECKRSIISSFRQFSIKPKKDTKEHEDEENSIGPEGVSDEESKRVRRKRTIAFPRMLPFRRQEKSPSLLEKPMKDISEGSGPVSLFTNFVGTHLGPGEGGTEPGSSTGSIVGSWMGGVTEAGSSMATVVGSWMGGSVGEPANEKVVEVPSSIIVKNKSSFKPNLVSMKNKMWSPRLPKVVAGGDEDNINEEDDERIESDEENDHKMALLRKRWTKISKGNKNKKLSIGVEIRDASGHVVRKIWLHSHRNESMIEVTDMDASGNIISQGYLCRPEAEKIEGWLKEKKRRRGWKPKKKEQEQVQQPVAIDCNSR